MGGVFCCHSAKGASSTIATQVTINADIDTVWSIIEDLDNYDEWNPMHTKVTPGKSHRNPTGDVEGHTRDGLVIVRGRRTEIGQIGTELFVELKEMDHKDYKSVEAAEVITFSDGGDQRELTFQYVKGFPSYWFAKSTYKATVHVTNSGDKAQVLLQNIYSS